MRMEIDAYALDKIAQLVGGAFSVIAINTFLHIFFQRAKRKSLLIATYIVYFLTLHIVFRLFQTPVINIGLNLLFVFMLTCNYPSRLRTRIISTIYLNAITMMVETITLYIAILSGLDEANRSDAAIISMLSWICAYFVILIMRNINIFHTRLELPPMLCFAVCMIPIGSIAVIFFMVITKSSTYLFMLVNTIAVFLINLVVFNLYYYLVEKFNQTIKIKAVEQQNLYYEKQLKMMMDTQEQMRRFRHDEKTKMMVLQSILTEGRVDKAVEYLNKMHDDFTMKKEISSTGNVSVDAVINYKLQKVEEHNIHVDLCLKIPRKLGIDSMDIAVLLGNLLDNAVTAIQKLESGRKITLGMEYDRNVLYIHVKNPYQGDIKVYRGKYYTTKADKKNHGIGLISIQNIVDKYNGEIEIHHENQQFIVDIVLYLNNIQNDTFSDSNTSKGDAKRNNCEILDEKC